MASGRLWKVCRLPADAVTAKAGFSTISGGDLRVGSVAVALVARREIIGGISRAEWTRRQRAGAWTPPMSSRPAGATA